MVKKFIRVLKEEGQVIVGNDIAEALEAELSKQNVEVFIFPSETCTTFELIIPEE